MGGLPQAVPVIQFVLSSRGMSKGIAQTTGPQLLARVEIDVGRTYAAAYAKNVNLATSDGEAGAVVGVRTRAAGFKLAASAALKHSIAPSPGSVSTAVELSGSVARTIGRLTPLVSAAWSPKDLGTTGRSLFVEAGASYAVASRIAASAAIGRRTRPGSFDYTAWNAGVAWTPATRLALDLRYYDTDAGSAQPYRTRVVVAATLKS